MAPKKPVGWRGDSIRHSLAAKGIKTGSAKERRTALKGASDAQLQDEYRLVVEDMIRNIRKKGRTIKDDDVFAVYVDKANRLFREGQKRGTFKRHGEHMRLKPAKPGRK